MFLRKYVSGISFIFDVIYMLLFVIELISYEKSGSPCCEIQNTNNEAR